MTSIKNCTVPLLKIPIGIDRCKISNGSHRKLFLDSWDLKRRYSLKSTSCISCVFHSLVGNRLKHLIEIVKHLMLLSALV